MYYPNHTIQAHNSDASSDAASISTLVLMIAIVFGLGVMTARLAQSNAVPAAPSPTPAATDTKPNTRISHPTRVARTASTIAAPAVGDAFSQSIAQPLASVSPSEAPAQPLRTWVDAKGRKVVAVLVELTPDTVTLENSDGRKTVRRMALSVRDLEYLKGISNTPRGTAPRPAYAAIAESMTGRAQVKPVRSTPAAAASFDAAPYYRY